MVFDARSTADSLERDLRAVATVERAVNEKRYLKSDLEFLGATVGDIRRTVRALIKDHGDLKHGKLTALVEELWRKPVHERRMAAVVFLESCNRLLTIKDLELIERLIRESKTWALVDGLAGKVTGAVARRDEQTDRILDRWSQDDDFWVRRAALLALMTTLKEGGDFERFGHYAETMLDDKEFFIRKAIGWVLREASKSRPDEVFGWLAPRTARISGVTIREAVKYLGAGEAGRPDGRLQAAPSGRPCLTPEGAIPNRGAQKRQVAHASLHRPAKVAACVCNVPLMDSTVDDMEITLVTEDDLPQVLPLMHAYCHFYQVNPSNDDLLDMSRSLIADPSGMGVQLIARDDSDAAVGFATLVWTWSTLNASLVGIMNDLFVVPEARGLGMADELITACCARCRARGATVLSWQTAKDNHRAQAVYERVGAEREEWLDYSLHI